jgi:hypothetical protein
MAIGTHSSNEAGWRDADDRERAAIDHRAGADDVRVRVESLPPEALAQDGDRMRVRNRVFFSGEGSADRR